MSQICPWHHDNEPLNFSQTRNDEHLQFLLHEVLMTETRRIRTKSELKSWNNWWTHSRMGLDPELQIECTGGGQHCMDPLLDFVLKDSEHADMLCTVKSCCCWRTHMEPFPPETQCVHSAGSNLGEEHSI